MNQTIFGIIIITIGISIAATSFLIGIGYFDNDPTVPFIFERLVVVEFLIFDGDDISKSYDIPMIEGLDYYWHDKNGKTMHSTFPFSLKHGVCSSNADCIKQIDKTRPALEVDTGIPIQLEIDSGYLDHRNLKINNTATLDHNARLVDFYQDNLYRNMFILDTTGIPNNDEEPHKITIALIVNEVEPITWWKDDDGSEWIIID